MESFHLTAALLTLSALFGYVNYRWLKMPAAIGTVVVALAFSLALVVAGHYWPSVEQYSLRAVERVPLGILSYWQRVGRGMIYAFTWSGLRGGISLALALSLNGRLPVDSPRNILLPLTYVVVVFSVVVQGLTVRKVILRMIQSPGGSEPPLE